VKFSLRPALAVLTLGVAVLVAVFVAGISNAAAQAPAAPAAGAYVLHDLQCDQHDDGVLDLTLVNDDPANTADFTVATGATPSKYEVASLSARAITMSGLADGPVIVPVLINGAASSVSVTVACDRAQGAVLPPTLAPSTTAVASGVPHAGAPATTPAAFSSPADGAFVLPSTGSSVLSLVIGGALVVAGIAASLIARRRYG
jgi:LPXTG-motif cell wall-anchored protein